jgi:hypothetical protein
MLLVVERARGKLGVLCFLLFQRRTDPPTGRGSKEFGEGGEGSGTKAI